MSPLPGPLATNGELHPGANVLNERLFSLDQDGLEALTPGGLSGRPGACERVEDNSSRRCHEPAKMLHEVERLDGRVFGPEAVLAAGLGRVEEPRRRTRVGMPGER